MNEKYIKYLRTSYYLLGLGLGFIVAGVGLFEYDTQKGWFHATAGVISVILGGIFGALAQKEVKK